MGYYSSCWQGCANNVDTLNPSDLFSIFHQNSGCERTISAYNFAKYVLQTISDPREFITQYLSPSESGFVAQINNNSDNTHLILTPSEALTTGKILLPNSVNLVDKQEVLVTTTQQISVLTVDGNGANFVYGAPTVLAAYDFFKLKFDLLNQTWNRVG